MTEMTRHEIDQMLIQQRLGRLSMADLDGRPYTIPLPFSWLDGAIYLRLPMTGRKGATLQANNRVCFEVDRCSDSLDTYASVILEGRLVPVEQLDEKRRARDASREKYTCLRGGHRPGHGRTQPLEALALQKIHVTQLAGRKKDPLAISPK